MSKVNSITKIFYIFLASISFSTFVLIVVLNKLNLDPTYKDFIVGSIAWSASRKLQDLLAGPFFIATLLAFIWMFLKLDAKTNDHFGEIKSRDFTLQLAWWSIPFILTISHLFFSKDIEIELLRLTLFGLLVFFIAVVYSNFKKIDIHPYQISLTTIAVLLIALLPLEVAIIISRLPMGIGIVGNYNPTAFLNFSSNVLYFCLFFAIILTTVFSKKVDIWLPKLLIFSQLGLPLFFLSLYPVRLNTANMGLIKYDTTVFLKILVITLIVWGVFDVIKRYQQFSNDGQQKSITDLLSPIAIFALLVVFKMGATARPIIMADDYHFGERLLGGWLYLQGVIPYVGYFPPHGLIHDDLPVFINYLFYDGFAGSINQSANLAAFFIALVGFFSLFQFSKSIGFAFILTFLLPWWHFSWLILIPFFVLWTYRPFIQNPSRWLVVWIFSVPILVFFVPPQGIVLVASSSVIAIYCGWIMLKFPHLFRWKEIASSIALLAILMVYTPLGFMLMGAVNYVLENAAINQVAYGIPIVLSWRQEGAMSGLMFEIFRNFWVWAIFISVVTVYLGMKDFTNYWWSILVGLLVILFTLLMISYAMGRVGSGGLSRPSTLSAFSFLVLLPVLLWGTLNKQQRFLGIIAATFIAGVFHTDPNAIGQLKSSIFQKINTPALVSGEAIGLRNIGTTSVEDNKHLQRLLELNKLLSAKLQPDETYLDLTNRNAQYFYLNRKPPVAVTAPYNMVPIVQQQQSVRMIEQTKPKLALFSAETITHDGGGLALRSPILFRYIFNHYNPSWEGRFIVGYLKGEDGIAKTESHLTLLDQSFSQKDLKKIPVAWGRSGEHLSTKMHLVHTIDPQGNKWNHVNPSKSTFLITGSNPYISYDLAHLGVSGAEAGLLKFDFTCIGQSAEPEIKIFWWGDQQPGTSYISNLKFTADHGTLIIPLDSQPRWLDLKNVAGIRINLDNSKACRAIKIENPGLYQRNSLTDN